MRPCNVATQLTKIEIQWIISALNHVCAHLHDDMEHDDGGGLAAVAEVMYDGRKNLVKKLNDAVECGQKNIKLI